MAITGTHQAVANGVGAHAGQAAGRLRVQRSGHEGGPRLRVEDAACVDFVADHVESGGETPGHQLPHALGRHHLARGVAGVDQQQRARGRAVALGGLARGFEGRHTGHEAAVWLGHRARHHAGAHAQVVDEGGVPGRWD